MNHIIFILHGYDQKPRKYQAIKKAIEEKYPGAIIRVPYLGLKKFSTIDPDDVVARVLTMIDDEWADATASLPSGGSLPGIILIGHSTGAVLTRKLYVAACGENADAPLEDSYKAFKQPRLWAAHVQRIILMAGMNRGWTINPHLYTTTAILIRIGVLIGHLMRLAGFEPLAFKTRRGAFFITQLRIQWISMLRHASQKKTGNTLIIQLLGTTDDIISPEDNVDILTGNKFIYLEVPASDHMSVLKMDSDKNAAVRKQVFQDALVSSAETLKQKQVMPVDDFTINEDLSVTDVIFVVHGIRDTGYWTQKVARRIKFEGDKVKRKFATETSTYGYFAMLPFLLPFVRRQKVEWLMDKYTENIVLYPNAKFSFVGHSNGTYLLAKALREYPMCKFENVVFAGSVVQKHFEWDQMIRNGRVSKVYNFIATSDWVVAIFPKAFQTLRLQDIGSAGFDGFTESLEESRYCLKLVSGGHGAAIDENYWSEIAQFIVNGQMPGKDQNSGCKRSAFMKILGNISPIPFLVIIASLCWLTIYICQQFSGVSLVVVLMVYLAGVWKIVTSL